VAPHFCDHLSSHYHLIIISKVLAAGAERCGKKRGKKDDRSAPHERRMKAAKCPSSRWIFTDLRKESFEEVEVQGSGSGFQLTST
jgi:hypothetical protein